MSAKAKVFMNGRSQAIRMPMEFRVSGKEVTLKRVPQGILITERDPWDVCKEACEEMSESFFKAVEARNQKLQLETRAWSDDA